MTKQFDTVEQKLLQAHHLWHIVATAKPVEDKIEAATALRNMAADKQNFNVICAAVDFDHVQRLLAHPTLDNRLLVVELNALTKTITAHSFFAVKSIDMAAIQKSLVIADNRRLDALNDIVAIIGVTPVASKTAGVENAAQPPAIPLWSNQSLTIDQQTSPHVVISFATPQDCVKLKSILSEIGIPYKYGPITRKDAESSPHCVYIQTDDLRTLTHAKCEWVTIIHASAGALAVLNESVKNAQLTTTGNIDKIPQWQLNSDTNTNHKVAAYLNAHHDSALLSYSRQLHDRNIAHKCYYRGLGSGCLVISRDQLLNLHIDDKQKNQSIPSIAIGPRVMPGKSMPHRNKPGVG